MLYSIEYTDIPDLQEKLAKWRSQYYVSQVE